MRSTLISRQRELLLNLRNAQTQRATANNEIASGYRVRRPSDDPSDAAGVVRTRTQLAGIKQFNSNLHAVEAELRAVDGALFDAVNALQRGAQLASQGANSTNTPESRANIAKEVDGIFRHVLSIANTVYDGRYVFGGSQEAGAPFSADPASTSGVRYDGDGGQRSILFPDGRPAQISLPGDAIFAAPDVVRGQGRTAPAVAPTPSPPIGVGVAFSDGLDAVISVDLPGPFIAAAPPAGAGAGDTLTVTFTPNDGSAPVTIATPPLAGGENAAALAGLLNTEIAANPDLTGKVSFEDQGGSLAAVVSETAGTGYSFTSTSSGGLVSGLESGGVIGGFSAEEIASALQQAADQNAQLAQAGVSFTAVDGEVRIDSDVDVTVTGLDFARGSAFESGLAGRHRLGGSNSADIFSALHQLGEALRNNDEEAIEAAVPRLQRAVDHISGALGFYGSTLRQIDVTLGTLERLDSVQQERLSIYRDADILESISDFQAASSAEQFALQVAARQQPTLLDVLA